MVGDAAAATIADQLPIGLHEVLGQAPIVLFAIDREGVVTLSEGRGLDRMGFQPRQLVGQNVHELYRDRPDYLEHSERALAGESFCVVDTVGSGVFETHFAPRRDEAGAVVGVVGICVDVTERHTMQLRLLQVERLAAMGTIAATVAHEINNPLTYVLANLEVLASRVRHSPLDVSRLVAEIREGAERVVRIVGDLKGFARDEEQAEPTDVVDALERAITLTGGELRKRAQIVRDYRPVPFVLASAPRLGQVFVNLLVNAGHAIPDDGEHQVIARVRPEGELVVIDIEDDGVGIPPDALCRVFDPFFTTKANGTGLGLSISQQIVQRFGGRIFAKSTLGSGSTFSVQLRVA